jgi:hypothetical protein
MVGKLMELNGMRDNLKTFVQGAIENTSETLLKNVVMARKDEFLKGLFNEEDYVEAFSKIYAEYLTASEVLDLIAYHKTPTGRKMTALQSTIAKRIIDVTQELIGNSYIRVMAKAMDANYKDFKDQLRELGLDDVDVPEN